MKFAAIDIGSNAVRLLLGNVYESKNGPIFKKADLVRIPLRLGEDAFIHKKISNEKIDKLILAMKSFRHIMDFHEVVDYKACATSAMREALNGVEIAEHVLNESGIAIEIIGGKNGSANYLFQSRCRTHEF